MKKISFIIISIFFCVTLNSQNNNAAFEKGEWLRFKMSYSGFLKAGYATLSVDEKTLKGKKVFHCVGKGWTTGFIKWFFKVDDTYETYIDYDSHQPLLFKRNIYEGGYTIKREISFDHQQKKAEVKDLKKNTTDSFDISDVQDMLSSFYFLRNQEIGEVKKNGEVKFNIFMDSDIYPFKLKYLGDEVLNTTFGKIKTMKFKPLVQAGRVFKENESVTIWITADKNKIPIKLNASLAVGSLRAELDAYKGLKNSFKIIYD